MASGFDFVGNAYVLSRCWRTINNPLEQYARSQAEFSYQSILQYFAILITVHIQKTFPNIAITFSVDCGIEAGTIIIELYIKQLEVVIPNQLSLENKDSYLVYLANHS